MHSGYFVEAVAFQASSQRSGPCQQEDYRRMKHTPSKCNGHGPHKLLIKLAKHNKFNSYPFQQPQSSKEFLVCAAQQLYALSIFYFLLAVMVVTFPTKAKEVVVIFKHGQVINSPSLPRISSNQHKRTIGRGRVEQSH